PEFPGGQEFQLNGANAFSPAVGQLVLDGIATGLYIVEEETPTGWTQTALIIDGVAETVSETALAVVAEQDETVVEFYNQPGGRVRVEKSTFASGSPIDERGGWHITVTGCGIVRSGDTNASGVI